ncbi:MAG TPA: shikimate dehydrogenase [Syntrophales bacterium]|nr:shikimate dehydrogenase [Syntrophales bacterium]
MSGGIRIFALFGNPVGHSLSPLMHNAAFKKLGIGAMYVPLSVDRIGEAVSAVRSLGISGVSVTIPFKTAVMDHLDCMDEAAREIGAVNTIINEGGKLAGANTDWLGLSGAVSSRLGMSGKTFAVIGAGGAARAAAYAIIRGGGSPVILNRTAKKAEELARSSGADAWPLERIGRLKAEGLINATPVGMHPAEGGIPVPPICLKNFGWVIETVYNPYETMLLKAARASGCRTIRGLEMFVRQGAEQIRIWTGAEPPRDFMKRTVAAALKKTERGKTG